MTVKDIKIDGNSLHIREFKLNMMCDHPSICMIAKRGSGKSWVCRAILNYFRDIPGGVIISPTDRMSSFYGKFFPEVYIHYEYSTELIQKILQRQKDIIEKSKEKAKNGKKVDPRAILVMDDCLSSKGTWAKDECIMEMFFNGRHYMVMYILTMQFPLGISPELRGNFDYIFLLSEDFTSNQKRMFDHYAGMFPNLNSFRQVFTTVTADYGCMVIVNRGAKNNFLDKVFWYKADVKDITTVGSRQFNKFHEVNYDTKWKKKAKPFDIGNFVEMRKNSKIAVDKMGPPIDKNDESKFFH
jgi:hypothetical protein